MELSHFYDETKYNFMPLCITNLVIFPSYVKNFGYKSAFLTISISYGLSRLQRLNKMEKKNSWSLCSWLKLLGLIARLGLSCSSFGHLLSSYQGLENRAYHLFPQIPWVMPVTVPLVLTIFISLGLQPSSVIKLIFDILFGIILSTFTVLGLYIVYTESNTMSLEIIAIDEAPAGILFFLSQFIIQTNGKNYQKKNHTCVEFWLCLLVMGILAFLNEKMECNGLGSCLRQYYTWYEPLFLALSISCVGLCLVDFYVAASELLKDLSEFEKLHATFFRNINFSSTLSVGLVCMSLVYLYSSTMLIILCNSSILLALSLENLEDLNMLINNRPTSTDEHINNDTPVNKYSKLNQNDSIELSSSDGDSCSDIDAIVEEYRSQIRVVRGLNLVTDIYLKRASYIFKMILITIAVCSILISLAIQSKLYKFGIGMATAILILILLLQWASNSVNTMLEKPMYSVYSPVIIYTINTYLIGYIPSSIWIYIIVWTIKGAALKMALITLKKFSRGKEFKHFFSIRESPPVFGTSCITGQEKKKTKIIHA